MKKSLMIFIPIILLLLVVLLTYVLRQNNQIPLIDGLRFGMSPKQAAKVLGEPCTIEHDAGNTGKSVYAYQSNVLGQAANVSCYFSNNRKLTEVSIRWENNSADLYEQAYTCLFSYYSNDKHFFVKEQDTVNTEEKHIALGLDDGTTGIFYNLYETSTSFSVSCIELS